MTGDVGCSSPVAVLGDWTNERDVSEQIKVALVDDYVLVRKGMGILLEAASDIEVVGEAADGDEVVDMVGRARPDVVLMDLRMPRVDGIEATRQVRKRFPDVRVLVLTAYADDHRVLEAVRAGASGYLLKDVEERDLHEAVRAAHAGSMIVASGAAADLVDGLERDERERSLTEREREVLGTLADGVSNREIAKRLGVSEKTVKNHVSSILAKLDLSDRTQAALYAVRHGYAEAVPTDRT